jgi:hypothetical protein
MTCVYSFDLCTTFSPGHSRLNSNNFHEEPLKMILKLKVSARDVKYNLHLNTNTI